MKDRSAKWVVSHHGDSGSGEATNVSAVSEEVLHSPTFPTAARRRHGRAAAGIGARVVIAWRSQPPPESHRASSMSARRQQSPWLEPKAIGARVAKRPTAKGGVLG